MRLYPSRAEFDRLAETCNIIPVYTELAADMETPVSLYYKLVGEKPGFMLESAETSKTFGRYSFLGTDPFMTVTARPGYTEAVTGQSGFSIGRPPLAAMQELLDKFVFPDLPELPPFSGGAVGYYSYETAATWERIRGMTPADDAVLGEFLFCRVLVAMDHLTHTVKLIYLAEVDAATDAAVAYAKAGARLVALAEKLQQPVAMPGADGPAAGTGQTPPEEAADKAQFMAAVDQAKEYIAAGDIFQVVLSQPFRRKLPAPPFVLYRRLRRLNPSPYMFYVNFGHRQLVGASPEMLVKLQDGKVFTCPIAGTRPRGRDAAEDARLAEELLADAKERAEHAMLVDLGRNDLGRISQPGTVTVSRMMQIERFSHVMHIVSEVTGSLDPAYSPTDVLAACFPAGTVSGAPKIRAMEIINELEDAPRGPYAGALGYFDFRGNLDTCITIRTLAVTGDDVVIQTGAGIVADSVPENEYYEIRHKARAMFQVLGGG